MALAVVAGVIAVGQQRRAVAQTRASAAAALEADANRVAALALNTEDAQLSLLLAVAAERLAPGVVTDRSLSSALAARAELIATATTTTSAATPASSLGDLASAGSRVYALDGRHVLHVFTTGLRPLGIVDLGNGRIDRGPARLTAAANLVAAAAGPGQSPAIKVVDALSLQPAGLALERIPQKQRAGRFARPVGRRAHSQRGACDPRRRSRHGMGAAERGAPRSSDPRRGRHRRARLR